MRKTPELLSRDEAIKLGMRFYGDVAERRVLDEDGDPTDDLYGTSISIRAVKDGSVLVGTTVERAYISTDRKYKRFIRRELGRTARSLASYNAVISS